MDSQLMKKYEVEFTTMYELGPSFAHILESFIKDAINSEFDEHKIRYKFTNDEYGEEAKQLHKEIGGLKRSYLGDAGIDLPIVLNSDDKKLGSLKIWPGEREKLHTGIIMEFPVGYFGRIVHRSSTEKVHRLRVIEGIIDDYRGEVLVQVHNQNTSVVEVHHGARLGQLILAKTAPFAIELASKLRPSSRGDKGFGSSGK